MAKDSADALEQTAIDLLIWESATRGEERGTSPRAPGQSGRGRGAGALSVGRSAKSKDLRQAAPQSPSGHYAGPAGAESFVSKMWRRRLAKLRGEPESRRQATVVTFIAQKITTTCMRSIKGTPISK